MRMVMLGLGECMIVSLVTQNVLTKSGIGIRMLSVALGKS